MNEKHGGNWAEYQEQHGCMPLDFSANVSPLGLPTGVHKAALRALDNAALYPDPECRALCRSLSEYHNIPAQNIVCGNGAADLIYRICHLLKPQRALVTAPSFGEYEKALQSVGCTAERFPLSAELDFFPDAEGFAHAVKEAELVFLCNPNNPTGRLSSQEELEKLLRTCRETGTVLVLDECFLDFTAEPEKNSMIPTLKSHEELIILKAFTKTYAMAGLRLGYALCGNAMLAAQLHHGDQPWSVSLIAQEAGIAALQESGYVEALRRLMAEERPRMRNALQRLGLRVVPGTANFLLFYCEDFTLCEKLRKHGILLRNCGQMPGLREGWYRTAVRTAAENDVLLAVLEEVLRNG